MIDERHRANHWIATKGLVFLVIAVFLGMVIALPIFYNSLGGFNFLGFPLGYFLLAFGSLVVMVALAFWIAIKQDRVDRKYGASENL